MVGENTVEMKKLEEITLEDIQNYLRKYDCDGVITTKLVEKTIQKPYKYLSLMGFMTILFGCAQFIKMRIMIFI